ncbi:hypothetical protein EV702DRAFT_981646, partial [Suillus placidus]
NEVIPSLIILYLAYLCKLTSLCNRIELQPDEVAAFQCRSSCRQRALEITCILFNYIETLQIDCCTCAPAPLQLLACGYFSCAPIAPSLTVDLQLLELVKTLFVHITPDMTAWCETLKVFLAGCGYQLTTKVSQASVLNFGHLDQYYCRIIFAINSVTPIIGTVYSA